jgi:hypothetical protein
MVNIKEQIDFILRGGTVERFHTRPLIHKQNNAEHQYGVASIAAILDPEISQATLLHFLWHDIHEGETGDIPYYSKLHWPALKEVLNTAERELNDRYSVLPDMDHPDFDKITLKISEYFDVLIFTCKETYLGNKEFKTTIKECVQLIIKLNATYPDNDYSKEVQTRVTELLSLILVEYTNKSGDLQFYSTMGDKDYSEYLLTGEG